MDASTIVSFITSAGLIGSMTLNWVQYRSGKRERELSNFEKQLEILEKLQEAKDQQYKSALKIKDNEIESLKKSQEALNNKLNDYEARLTAYQKQFTVLQNAVNKLIGDSCKKHPCPARISYPTEDLGDILGITY